MIHKMSSLFFSTIQGRKQLKIHVRLKDIRDMWPQDTMYAPVLEGEKYHNKLLLG